MPEYLTIARVAAMTGFSVPTLRFYETEGLIPAVPRDGAGNRQYGEQEMSRINTIRCLRAAGLSLPEMKRYFSMVEQGASTIRARRELLLDTRENLRRQHAELQKCMLYLAQKISYYDIALEALDNGESLPEYKFGAANSIFAPEDLVALDAPAARRPRCPSPARRASH